MNITFFFVEEGIRVWDLWGVFEWL